ncbi:MAG: preprotein translocase subunit SecA [Alphaproteobacteria bacterium]|nr:preprotein translocase subunit SecA [Alphaproteobacteria bacterium]|tara:strand:- start:873 stop:3626 length:2754 start_codon:yes stop_codon:yes gene_type:complete
MLLNLATKIFGSSNERQLKKMRVYVEKINALEPEFEKLDDAALKGKTAEFRTRLKNGETEDDILVEAFATVREAAKRSLGLRPFDVQLIGGLALHKGIIAEMRTGEGKTLVATLPAYLNAISGKGVHVVTVNDYLAERDSAWMAQVYEFLGLSVGCITSNIRDDARRAAYNADITYGTNNEFGFDYLRDNMKFSLNEMVQRPYNFAIIDEVDSILVDEARTPLIISGPSESSPELYVQVDKLIPMLTEDDYELDEKMKSISLNDQGSEHIEQLLKDHNLLTDEEGLYDAQNIMLVHHVNQALRAHKLFEGDKDYIVKDGKVVLIDEFTGRMMEGRRFSDGLHQALEAREGVEIQQENQTLASVTFQNFFRMYPKIGGMTGTAQTEATEFMEIYKLGVLAIPTNVPVSRIDHDDEIYKSLADKEIAILERIKNAHEKKQPVLVGTVSIEKSESLSRTLKKHKIPHHVLNARYHEQEAYIIGQAGVPGAVTIATNMAGRGTDIKLGGNLEMRAQQEIPADTPEDKRSAMIEEIKAEIAENEKFVKEMGGLMVIGTERHESRRIDNQLRGRCGRQGDPGETIFYLSVEDDLMRIFSPEALEAVLSNAAIGLRDGEALTHPWLSKALEKAQARVERQNFEIRKNLLKFDDVMNDQRKIIYEQRRDIMDSDSVEDLVKDIRHDVIESVVQTSIPKGSYAEQWQTDHLKNETMRLLGLDLPIDEWAQEEGIADNEILERIIEASDKKMDEKAEKSGREFFREIEKSFVLQTIDNAWKDHLLQLDHLRQGINLRAIGQRDPLNEFKTEAFSMFETMLTNMSENITQNLSVVEFNLDAEALQKLVDEYQEQQNAKTGRALSPDQADGAPVAPQQPSATIIKPSFDKNDPDTWGKVPRNADCPCGSGKKYKHCHGKIVSQKMVSIA